MKTLLRSFPSLAFFLLAAAVAAPLAHAGTTQLVNYQGKVTRNGTNVTGPLDVTFRIFTGETNTECVFEEAQQVTAKDGLYSTLIGKNPTLGDIAEAARLDDAFLEVTINGTALKPRERFTPPPFAHQSSERWSAWMRSQTKVSEIFNVYSSLSPCQEIYAMVRGSTNYTALYSAAFPPPAAPVKLQSVKFMIAGYVGSTTPPNLRFVVQPVALSLEDVHRPVGPPLELNASTVAAKSWLSVPLSPSANDRKLAADEFLCLTLRGLDQDFAMLLMVDIRVK